MKFEIEKSELLGKRIYLRGVPGYFEDSNNKTGAFGRCYYYPPNGPRQLVASIPLGIFGNPREGILPKSNTDYGNMRIERIHEFASRLMSRIDD